MYFVGFVSPVDVCPASSEHILLPRGYQLLFLSSTLSVGESRSWQRIGSSGVRWLPGYCTHVRLKAIIGINPSDHG